LFDCKRGKRLIKHHQVSGDIPYISSTKENNGVDNFIDPPSKMTIYSNCLTLNNSGSVGYCFYQKDPFVASDHVTVLKLKNKEMTRNIALFFIPIIETIKHKFNFAKEISDTRIAQEIIKIPVKNNEPDFAYMENYIENIYNNLMPSIQLSKNTLF
jgi:hypothetical protein